MKAWLTVAILLVAHSVVSQNWGELELGYFRDNMRLKTRSEVSLNNFLFPSEEYIFINWRWIKPDGKRYFVKIPFDSGLQLRQFEAAMESPFLNYFSFRSSVRGMSYTFDDLRASEWVDSQASPDFFPKSFLNIHKGDDYDVSVLTVGAGIHYQPLFRWIELRAGFDTYLGRQQSYGFSNFFKTATSNKVVLLKYEYSPSLLLSPQVDLGVFLRPLKKISLGYNFRGRLDFVRERSTASHFSWTNTNQTTMTSEDWVISPVVQHQLSIKFGFDFRPSQTPLQETSPPPGTSAARR